MVGSVPCGRMWGGAGGNGEVIGGGLCAWAVKTARGVPGGEWAARLWVRKERMGLWCALRGAGGRSGAELESESAVEGAESACGAQKGCCGGLPERAENGCTGLSEALGAVQERSWSRRALGGGESACRAQKGCCGGVCGPKEPKTAVRGFPRRWGPFRSGVGVGERWEAGNRPVERRKAAAGVCGLKRAVRRSARRWGGLRRDLGDLSAGAVLGSFVKLADGRWPDRRVVGIGEVQGGLGGCGGGAGGKRARKGSAGMRILEACVVKLASAGGKECVCELAGIGNGEIRMQLEGAVARCAGDDRARAAVGLVILSGGADRRRRVCRALGPDGADELCRPRGQSEPGRRRDHGPAGRGLCVRALDDGPGNLEQRRRGRLPGRRARDCARGHGGRYRGHGDGADALGGLRGDGSAVGVGCCGLRRGRSHADA